MPEYVHHGPGSGLFSPCMVCAMMPASVVEVPCGHVNVCSNCYGDYQSNQRCLRCRDRVSARADVSPFLHEITGRPKDCNMCRTEMVNVVVFSCVHMYFCSR